MQLQPSAALGDFVIAKGDGVPAYQLAVVVDDHDMGVNEVVRGDDLLFSTFRQLAIIRHFGWTEPDYWHVPLMVGPDGRRLAKRHGDTRLSFFRDQGIAPEVLIGYLAFTVNLLDSPRPIRAQELIGQLDWSRVPTAATAFNLDTWLPIFQAQSSP
jgi:glutamyl-tRNA synthetase